MAKIDLPSLDAVFFSYGTTATLTDVHFQAIKKALGGQTAKKGENEWQACRNYTADTGLPHHISLYLAKYTQEKGRYYIEIAYALGTPAPGVGTSAKFTSAIEELEKIDEPLYFFVKADFRYPSSESTVIPLPTPAAVEGFDEVRGTSLVKFTDDKSTFAYTLDVSLLPDKKIRCLVTNGHRSTFSNLNLLEMIQQAHDLSKLFFKPKE
jgi:hypothetical protein